VEKQPENEVVMYIIFNKDLKMSTGKIAAQAAHAAVLVILEAVAGGMQVHKDTNARFTVAPTSNFWNFAEWLQHSFKKIVLQAQQPVLEELEQKGFYAIRDAGHTQVPPGSITAVALPPMPRKDVLAIIKALKLMH